MILKTSPREDPPEPYNTWEEYFEDFDRQLEEAQPITIRERIGNPQIRPASEIPDSELEEELDQLIELLYANNIVIEFIHDIEDREAYVFITEELLNETMDDIHIPDMYSHFIYEEFHPNDEDDIELWTGEFLDTFFKEGTEGFFIPIGDKELYDADGNPISQEEFKKQIDEFHALYPIITEYNYDITGFQYRGRLCNRGSRNFMGRLEYPGAGHAPLSRPFHIASQAQPGHWVGCYPGQDRGMEQ